MKYLYALLVFAFCENVHSQNTFSTSGSNFQCGIGAKVSVEFGAQNKKKFPFVRRFYSPAYKISITGGLGYQVDEIDNFGFFPAIHTGFLIFNKGSIGADQKKHSKIPQVHFYLSGQLSARLDKRDFDFVSRNVPLYHFSEFNANPLQNPFKSSIAYGANWVFVQNKERQRIGFFNLNIAGRGQISYYNDGGPVLKIAGDKRDRYYTGGVIFSYHGDVDEDINLIELSYHKYTGYQKYAFDVADKLQIDFLNYNDINQFSYNQQRWRLNISSLKNGYGGSFSLYNVNRLDFQDFLHFNTNVPYHPDYYRGWRWMIGGRYEYNNTSVSR